MNGDDQGLIAFLDQSLLLRVILWSMLFAVVFWIGFVARKIFASPPPEEPAAPGDEKQD